MSIIPLNDRVVIEKESERTSAGGIVIPDSVSEKPVRGKAIAVGPGKIENGKTVPMSVKVGDKVLFGKYSGTEIKVDGNDWVVMREDDIVAIIED